MNMFDNSRKYIKNNICQQLIGYFKMYMEMKMAKHKYSEKRTNWSNYTSIYLELLKTCTHQDSYNVSTRTGE